jgi:3-methyladenine DNA glycosylase AlkC
MSNSQPTKGYASLKAIPRDYLDRLERGEIETRTLSEGLAINYRTLFHNVLPDHKAAVEAAYQETGAIVSNMQVGGRMLYELAQEGKIDLFELVHHTSDTVRCCVAYAYQAMPLENVRDRLWANRPFAADPHFGVREVAWLSVRPHILEDDVLKAALTELELFVQDADEGIRRFATELSRPRGVWCAHLKLLKQNPTLGFPLLDPLKADPSPYVRNSVANWLNDASKTHPEWVEEVTETWLVESPTKETKSLVARATRTLRKKAKG